MQISCIWPAGLDIHLPFRFIPNQTVKTTTIMKLSTLFLATALAALPLFASAQMAEPFTPPAGLHPHAQPTQHEILGDNALPQQSQKQFSSDVLNDNV